MPEAYSGKGDVYYYQNKNTEALEQFERAINLDSKYPEAYNGKGLILADLKNYKEALDFFDKAIELNRRNGEFYYNKGQSLEQLQDGEMALQCYLKAVEIDQNDDEFYNLLGLAFKKYREDYNKAFEAFHRANQINPRSPFYFYEKGLVLDILNRGDEAIACFREAIKIESNDSDFYCSLGLALNKYKKDHVNALDCFQKSIDLDPKPQFYFHKGETYYILEEYRNAVDCFSQSIALDLQNSDFHFRKGQALMFLSDNEDSECLKEAIECFEKAIELNPNDEEYYVNVGNAYRENKNIIKAIDCFKKATELNPRNENYFVSLGDAFNENKNTMKAMDCFKKALYLNPNKAAAYNGLGQAMIVQKGFSKDFKKAIEQFNRAIELDSLNPLYISNKAFAFNCMKDYASAIKCYDEAIELDPRDAELYCNKGNACKKIHNYEKAKECFKKAIKLKPDDKEAKKMLFDLIEFERETYVSAPSTLSNKTLLSDDVDAAKRKSSSNPSSPSKVKKR